MQKTKEQLLQEFAEMEGLEAEARDLYARTAADPQVTNEEVKRIFRTISAEEQAHVEIVQQIRKLLQNTL